MIKNYQLLPHPEGGYYRESYRSTERIPEECLPIRFKGERIISTAIYYLLGAHQFSAFHRIKSDELWHFYAGSALNIYIISPAGGFELITLGSQPDLGQTFQATVKAGHWFASEPTNPNGFSFMGCTVAPGFDFDDFEMANAQALVAAYPAHEKLILKFCR